MSFCPFCGAQVEENEKFCKSCGKSVQAEAPVEAPAAPVETPVAAPAAAYDENPDHTADFSEQDVSEHKVYAVLIYLLSWIGIIIALLASKDSEYLKFHIRQSAKILAVTILSVFLLIVPILGWIVFGIWTIVMVVIELICFFRVCRGKSIEPPIIRDFGFLK